MIAGLKNASASLSLLIPGLFGPSAAVEPAPATPALETWLARSDLKISAIRGFEPTLFQYFGAETPAEGDLPVAAVTRVLDMGVIDNGWWLRVPARSVLDYFDPDGSMNSYQNAARVKTGVAVLLAAPTREAEGLKRLGNETYEKLSANAKPSRVEIDADHIQAPDAAKEPVSEWLKRL